MRREYGAMGNRLAPQRDEMAARGSLEEERRKAREMAMMKRLSSKPATKYKGGY
jgi:hypothetical protein